MEMAMRMALVLLLCFCLTRVECQADGTYAQQERTIGVNYGTLGDNLPSPENAVAAMKAMKVGRVKLFNPNAAILTALANSGMEVVVMVPNEEIIAVGASPAAGEAWIQQHVAPYFPATNIAVILVGNEIFTGTASQATWASLVPAIENLQAALVARGLSQQVKVSTAVALDVLQASFPPSTGAFRADIAGTVIQPLLKFLTTTSSYLFVNVYPFLTYTTNPDISLGYAMFASTATANVVDGGLVYENLMDAQLDAVNAAAARLGFPGLRLSVGETGWPSAGEPNQPGASVENAALFNRRLVSKTITSSATPAKPGVVVPTYIFALFNENQKPGAATERHWGLLYPDLTPVYAIDLSGQTTMTDYVDSPILAAPAPDSSSGSGTWCVSNAAVDAATLENALNFACGMNAEFCAATQPGGSCYLPNTVAGHAAWALNKYWQSYKTAGGSCSFDGAGSLTSTDPSFGACVFPH